MSFCRCGRQLPYDYSFKECGVCRSFRRMKEGELEGDNSHTCQTAKKEVEK